VNGVVQAQGTGSKSGGWTGPQETTKGYTGKWNNTQKFQLKECAPHINHNVMSPRSREEVREGEGKKGGKSNKTCGKNDKNA